MTCSYVLRVFVLIELCADTGHALPQAGSEQWMLNNQQSPVVQEQGL